MSCVSKAAVQFLLTLLVFNTAVCACAGTVIEVTMDAHAHHQHSDAPSRTDPHDGDCHDGDCHDGACLGACSQAVAAKSVSVIGLAPVAKLELETAFLDTAVLTVTKIPAITRVSGPLFQQFRIPTDTPVTRKDRLLA
ncbi:MAG: hypothetical protein O7G86_01880 [Gammaproteobacteria bacterium]|nr:hypothetical protein [Gammaproteobacteria bacterium]